MKSRLIHLTIFAAGIGLVIAGITAAPRLASATPQFAGQTKKACNFCHVNPAGGGALTAAGKKFKENGNKL